MYQNTTSVQTFGSPIDPDGDAPPILSKLVRYLLQKGVTTEGIFKVKPLGTKEVHNMKRKIKIEGDNVQISSCTQNPHVVAEVTKEFLALLPEPLLTYDFYDSFLLLLNIKYHEDRMNLAKEYIHRLPNGFRSSVKQVLGLLSRVVTHFDYTKVTAEVLAVDFGPIFLRATPTYFREADKVKVEELTVLLIKEYESLIKSTSYQSLPSSGPPPTVAPKLVRGPSMRYSSIAVGSFRGRLPIVYFTQQKKLTGKELEVEAVHEEPVETTPDELERPEPRLENFNDVLTPGAPEEDGRGRSRSHEELIAEEIDLRREDEEALSRVASSADFAELMNEKEEIEAQQIKDKQARTLSDSEDTTDEKGHVEQLKKAIPSLARTEKVDSRSGTIEVEIVDSGEEVDDERKPSTSDDDAVSSVPRNDVEMEMVLEEETAESTDNGDEVEAIDEDMGEEMTMDAIGEEEIDLRLKKVAESHRLSDTSVSIDLSDAEAEEEEKEKSLSASTDWEAAGTVHDI